MEQVDPFVLDHKYLGTVYSRFDQMSVDHKEDQQQFQITVPRLSQFYHVYHLIIRVRKGENVTQKQ